MTTNGPSLHRDRDPADEAAVEPESTVLHNGVAVDRRRLLGAYYTPEDLAGILVRWALTHRTGAVLDPSFGGCAFLNAATDVLREKGVQDPGALVYGVDVDQSCVDYVRENPDLRTANCVFRDFLELRPEDMPGTPFEAIVGNPPFVRHHWMKGATRSAARALVDGESIMLPATASAWAYFVVHALSFLREGGRFAMLVPEAILQADYAEPIREALAERFRRVTLIHIRDRLFEGTDEPVVVIAGAGYGAKGTLRIDAVESAGDLVGALSGSVARRRSPRVTVANGRSVSKAVLELLTRLEENPSVSTFDTFATARIGLVTGANNHFIRSRRDLTALQVPVEATTPVVSRTTWLSGLEFTSADHRGLVDANRRALLVHPGQEFEEHGGVQAWIQEGQAAGVHLRFKCSERTPWYRVDIPAKPDAFATCTRLASPLLVLNRPGYSCTNALYSVRWKPNAPASAELVALGFLTTAVTVWAELHGRRYGGGVLKLDLGTLAKVPVPVVDGAEHVFDDVDRLLREGRESEARQLADQVVLVAGLGMDERDVKRLQRAQRDLVAQRVPAERRPSGG